MRSLVEIEQDLQELNKNYNKDFDRLKAEKLAFQKLCPHPETFVKVDWKDYFDEAGAPVYETSFSTAICHLCRMSVTKEYNKRNNKYSQVTGYNERRPTAQELLNG